MDRTDRVVRTNDRDNVKPSLSLSGAPNIKERRMKKQQQMMPNKGWEINDKKTMISYNIVWQI